MPGSKLRVLVSFLVTGTVFGCAATTPSPAPPIETLVVLNAGDASLTWVQLSDSGLTGTILLGSIGGTPQFLTARGSQILVTTGVGNTLARLGLTAGQSPLIYRFPAGAGTAGTVFVNDTLAYVAHPFSDRTTRINFKTGDTASVGTGRSPTALAFTRGRVFVANANLEPVCSGPMPCVQGPSWLTAIDPERNVMTDSIPLTGPGNAVAIEVSNDGLLYVLSAGAGGPESARVSIVDPIRRVEVGSFSGFGTLPTNLASDHGERLFVVSPHNGLMEFNTRTRRVVRGAESAIPLQSGMAVVVDDEGLIYVIESGSCSGDIGRIRVFRPDLIETRTLPAGPCALQAAIVKLPRSS
ncbi:MAG TPA: hypothetical protein VGP61_05870 [Gemmatimonadales bacterium]|jgi:hypothetical protein|nr:hypothetical protein [Gemmatimonadales bacterium]